ncbi:MAG: hypothetical protein WBC06_09170 [Chitinophagaceae bacterium]
MQTETTNTLVKVLAHLVKEFVLKKPGVSSLVTLALADGIEIKRVIDKSHSIADEILDLDSEEAQDLSATFTMELGDYASKTKIDEIFGRVLVLLPQVKAAISEFKSKDPERILDATYTPLKIAISIYNEFKAE